LPHLAHHVRGGDGDVEVHEATLDPFDQVVGAHDVGTRLPRLRGGRAGGEHRDADRLAAAGGQGDGAPHHLVGLAGVDAEAGGQLDGLVELGRGQLLDDVDRLAGRVQALAVVGPQRLGELLARSHQATLIPIERAVPATCFLAASRSLALRSGIFVLAISSSCRWLIVPTTSRPAVWDPFSRPAAARSSTGVGGVLVMKVKERSSKTVISTGTIVPRWDSVWALYILQKSMMFTPWGPKAVPTGGAGVAAPAGIWIFTMAATRFLAIRVSRPG